MMILKSLSLVQDPSLSSTHVCIAFPTVTLKCQIGILRCSIQNFCFLLLLSPLLHQFAPAVSQLNLWSQFIAQAQNLGFVPDSSLPHIPYM